MIRCVFLGDFKDERLSSLAEEYQKRFSKLWPVEVTIVPETGRDPGVRLRKSLKGRVVSLDAGGRSMDSAGFAQWVTSSSLDITFIAWGAEGPRPEWKTLAENSLSLSPMTTSHELARVLLLEQLYRAAAILKNHPYNK